MQVSRRVVRDVHDRLTKAAQYLYTGGLSLLLVAFCCC